MTRYYVSAFKDPISPLLNEISSLHQLQVLDLSDSGENEIQGLLGKIESLTQLTALNLKDSYLIEIDLSLLADTLTTLNLDGNGEVFFRSPSGVADVGKLEEIPGSQRLMRPP